MLYTIHVRKTTYPESIRRFRPKGTCLKKAGDIYNVYQVTSKRMPGKKYPVPQTGPLLGYIDGQDFHEKKKQVFDVEGFTSYEYGYTAFLLLHEDDFASRFKKSHGKLLAKEIKEVFRNIILILSPPILFWLRTLPSRRDRRRSCMPFMMSRSVRRNR